MKKGFTLIELLITITIMGILMTAGIVSYNAFTKNSRDVKRQADIKVLQSALEEYRADQNSYPTTLPAPGSSLTGGSRTYLKIIPNDPKGGGYTYVPIPGGCTGVPANSCTSYSICATMETPGNATSVSSNCSGFNYEVTPP